MILDDEQEDNNIQEESTPDEEHEETIDEVKKRLRSENEKGAQKLIKEKNKFERERTIYAEALKAVSIVADDQSKLLDIARDNPEVAQVILHEYYKGISIEEFEEQLTGKKSEPSMDANSMRKQIKEEVEQSVNQREVKKSISKFIEKAGFDEDTHEKFVEQLEELTDGKRLNSDNIQKYLKIAYAETVGYEKADNTLIVAKAMSAGNSAGGGTKSKSKEDSLLDDMRKTMAGMRY